MLDTVIVADHVAPSSKQLSHWVNHPLIFPDERIYPKYFQNVQMDNGAVLTFVHYPPNPPRYPLPWLGIQASIPMVLFGTNIKQITNEDEIEEAIDLINRFISGFPWLPKIDYGAESLWRLDAVYNHQVGSHIPDYVRALSKLDYRQRKTQPYLHEGVQFKSAVATTKFYDQEKKSMSSLASGNLRQESEYVHTYYIERRLGIEHPTLRDITIPGQRIILQEDLENLHLNNCTFVDRSKAQQVLINIYGYRYGNTLFGHLLNRQSMTKEQIIAQGANDRTIRNYEKQIADAGISLALTDDGMCLPPLEISISCNDSLPTVVSDT